ncbi:MAG: DUF2807 domain-containing protein [Flavobacteriales bacterium]|jgi:hypothetical protein|nr:DUF2807 domain-containing protein [Flavobacteriales bacterium]
MMKKIVFIISTTLLVASCSKIKKESSGSIVTEERIIGNFNTVELIDNIDVFYTQDSIQSLKVEAGEHLIDYIKTDIVNNKLVIYEANNDILNTKRIRVYISNDSINAAKIEGSGNFNGNDMNCSHFDLALIGSGDVNINATLSNYNITLSGSGNINSTGSSHHQQIEVKGSGNVGGKHFYTNNATVLLSGSGNITLQTGISLIATLTGSGNIYYYGNPSSVTTSVTGSGTIVHQN